MPYCGWRGDGGDQASSGIARILSLPVLHPVLVSNVALFANLSDFSFKSKRYMARIHGIKRAKGLDFRNTGDQIGC